MPPWEWRVQAANRMVCLHCHDAQEVQPPVPQVAESLYRKKIRPLLLVIRDDVGSPRR